MTYGKSEVFTSTFNGLFDRWLEKLSEDGLTGGELMRRIGYAKFRDFLGLSIGYGRINEFLATMDKGAQKQLLEKFVSHIETEKDFKTQAVIVADAFATIDDVGILAVIQRQIREEYRRVRADGNKEGIVLYGLLAGMFGDRAVVDADWFARMAARYGLPNLTMVKNSELTRNGVYTQLNYFYNDADGRASFANFLRQYRDRKRWSVKTEGKIVRIESVNTPVKAVILANIPAEGVIGRGELDHYLEDKSIFTPVIVHRGHSYHADSTICRINKDTRIVFLGSCGSYNDLDEVVRKAPLAHLISTKGTGTMYINDPILAALNREIALGHDIDWPEFWEKLENNLGGKEKFKLYVPPHKNLGVLYLKAYNKLTSGVKKGRK